MTYIISQIFETIALVVTLYSYHLKTKKSIFKGMCLSNILDIIHYFFLNAYSGLLTKVIALCRNIFILKKEDNEKLKSNLFLYIFIIIYVISAIITFKSIYSLLPFIAAIIYMIVVWNGNELQVKKIAFLCYFFWLIYNISVFSIMGIISNIVALISTYVAYYNYKNIK
jgi:hypothetical protein